MPDTQSEIHFMPSSDTEYVDLEDDGTGTFREAGSEAASGGGASGAPSAGGPFANGPLAALMPGVAPGDQQFGATWQDFLTGGVARLTEGQRGFLFVEVAQYMEIDAGGLEAAYRRNPQAINDFFDEVDLRALFEMMNAPQSAIMRLESPIKQVGLLGGGLLLGFALGSGALSGSSGSKK